jgi:heme oxygenase
MPRIVERIRAKTDAIHERLEQMPYAKAVLEGSIPLSSYVSFLRAVSVVHEELQRALASVADEGQAQALRTAVGGKVIERGSLLAKDLADLNADPLRLDGASLQALVVGQQMRLAALREPLALLGHAYVLEGSQLGGLVQHAALERRPEFQQGGLRYLASGDKRDYGELVRRLEAAVATDDEVDALVRGAVAHFEGFERILRAVDPARGERRLAEEMNADAGDHPAPRDLREMQAALRAGERSWRESPYYLARYGERGMRYTRSDSAWLVTLARQEEAVVERQIAWLARVLAARGMPTLLLERHLEILHGELARELPANALAYGHLQRAANRLREQRLGAIPRFHALAEGAKPQLEGGPLDPAEAAQLLIAAAADEKRELPTAVASLTSWLCDPARATPAFVAAAASLLAAVRAG